MDTRVEKTMARNGRLVEITCQLYKIYILDLPKLNETIFKAYEDAIANRIKAGKDVSAALGRLNYLIAEHKS